jgi:hypothetical protein
VILIACEIEVLSGIIPRRLFRINALSIRRRSIRFIIVVYIYQVLLHLPSPSISYAALLIRLYLLLGFGIL